MSNPASGPPMGTNCNTWLPSDNLHNLRLMRADMTPKTTRLGNSLIDLRVGICRPGTDGRVAGAGFARRVARLTAIERQADVRQLALRRGIVSDAAGR